MLSELVEAARQLRARDELPPTGTKQKRLTWIVEVHETAGGLLKGPYKGKDMPTVRAPDRQRSGTPSADNLKPYLLVDNGRYALGILAPGQVNEDDLVHRGFLDLLERAEQATGDPDLARILEFLSRPLPCDIAAAVGPGDVLTFQTASGEFPCQREPVQDFWASYLEQEVADDAPAFCAVCGQHGSVVRILPREIVVMGQKCQVSSFNLDKTAFHSFGKEQMKNAPLCFSCASDAINALDFFVDHPQHHVILARDESKSQSKNPLRNQLAVFWLRAPLQINVRGTSQQLHALLGAAMQGDLPSQRREGPPPSLSQLEEALASPWTGRESAIELSNNAFYLAVLSANKGRLVVREWVAVALDELVAHLKSFLVATRIVGPRGEPPQSIPIQQLVKVLRGTDPNLARGLLRTAYLGYPPPTELLMAAVQRFRIPEKATKDRREAAEQQHERQTLASVIKLVLTHGKDDAVGMAQLDTGRHIPAYLCGRLLAVLEEAQQRASRWGLNSTLVDQFYGAASSAPAGTFGTLLDLAVTAHLPKVRKERLGHGRLQQLMEEILKALDNVGGFPKTLTMPEQGEFAVGFYSQRSDFRTERNQKQEASDEAQKGGAA